MRLTLIRDEDNGVSTIGRLYCEDDFLAFTLENPWKNNEPRVSCIPAGEYELSTKRYGRYWEKYKPLEIPILHDVPGRKEILIHPGNFPKDTMGCILVGDKKGPDAVYNSRKTWRKIHNIISNAYIINIDYAN